MEYSLFSRDAEEQGQIDACKELGVAMMAYAVPGRGMLSAQVPKVEELAADDIRARLPRFHSANVEKNLRLRSALEAIARRKSATLAQLSIAWPMAQGSRAGAFIAPIPAAKSRKHLRRMCAPRTLYLQQTISRKSTASYRPVPWPSLAIR
jgi:aryl-alcohol dehydrogenase-like predicted oxidoreductase